MDVDDPNERPTLPTPAPLLAGLTRAAAAPPRLALVLPTPSSHFFSGPALEEDLDEAGWWREARRRWLARWVCAIVGMAAAIVGVAITLELWL